MIGGIAVVGLAGLAIYLLYRIVSSANVFTQDPATGEQAGPINNFADWLVPQTFPGGGEVVGSSETYTGAATTEILSPFQSTVAIFGGDVTSSPTVSDMFSDFIHPIDTISTLFGGTPTPAQMAQNSGLQGLRRR